MEPIPSGEANSRSASQEFPRHLWKRKVRYHVHTFRHWSLSHMYPVHIFLPYFSKIINLILKR